MTEASLTPRDVVKLAFQFQQHPEIPFLFNATPEQEEGLTEHYGGECWREWTKPYVKRMSGVDGPFSLAGYEETPDGYSRDSFGAVWDFGSILHLIEPSLRGPSLKGYRLPDVRLYIDTYLRPEWEKEIEESAESFRVVIHSFGLFERAWCLRGFENFLMDLHDNPGFCVDLLDCVTDWMLESIDAMLSVPVDAVMLTDDYADQRGMIFGLHRFRELFVPRWKRLLGRIKKAGVYSVLHVCGCAAPAVPDLIECGLDCLQSLQPEAMDIYKLKRQYGKDLRFWGGLGAQYTLPFGTPQEVTAETRKLKAEMGCGGGYILAGAKGIGEEVPVQNMVAYLDEARTPMEWS